MPYSYSNVTGPTYRSIITPDETLNDPVNKLRVSTPQSLIDTDFEYSSQSTKWEALGQVSNRPTAFYDVTAPITFTGISGAGTRVITVLTTANIAIGTPVYIQDSTNPIGNGWYLVDSTSGTQFTYTASANVTGSIYDTTKTFIFTGSFYSSSNIPVNAGAGLAFTNTGTIVTATTTNAHGLTMGNNIFVIGTTATTNAPNGAWTIASVPTSNTFTFNVANLPTGAITATAGANASLYPRILSGVTHRPYDGGVTFNTGTNSPNNQFIRQTRKFFRYQSGKGIQFSTGTILKPNFQVDSITSSGTTVTVNTKFVYNVGVGAVIYVNGCNETAYNGTFTVTGSPTATSFTFTALSTPSAIQATGYPLSVGLSSWTGSSVKVGMFGFQNGFYFETDGQTLWAVRRKSTDQLSGTIAVTNGSASVVGTNTLFSSQLKPGDFIVIRGSSYEISAITSDTQLFIIPEFKGITIPGNCIFSKTSEIRIPQSQWNIDKMDGTGPSRTNLDLTKMQMLYLDYTWYGAGNIRFGFRGIDGNVTYCHKIVNAGQNTEAYMRSGNLPARYEVTNVPYYSFLTSTLLSGATTGGTIALGNTSNFPSTGNVIITGAGNTSAPIEIISYTANNTTTNTLTIGNRAVIGGAVTAQTFTYLATAPIQVQLYTPQVAPTISHWGSSVVMDGRFDNDKSFVFQALMPAALSVNTASTTALMSVRLAPSVDSGQVGLLGARELINRMFLSFLATDTVASGTFLIQFKLNGKASAGTFQNVGGSSLAQICYHATGTIVTGGETIFSFFTNNGVTQQDLTTVRDLSTSILGGGTSNAVPSTSTNLYPDGGDVLTIVAQNVTATTQTIQSRVSWTEAQA